MALSSTYQGITIEEDNLRSVWVQDLSITETRIIRVSMCQFLPNTANVATWIYFKIFKRDNQQVFRQHQQVCYRVQEADRILQSIQYIGECVNALLLKVKDDRHFEKTTKFNITDDEDANNLHWYFDLFETQRRKTRVSYIMYDVKDPLISSYIQFKLFTREKQLQSFTRKQQINLTILEFNRLGSQAELIGERVRSIHT